MQEYIIKIYNYEAHQKDSIFDLVKNNKYCYLTKKVYNYTCGFVSDGYYVVQPPIQTKIETFDSDEQAIEYFKKYIENLEFV